jgi:acetylornithine/N-succinyldiaminopimelate aminotransferase
VRGENCYLYDSQAKRYVDFESGIWSTALGHNHPRINQVMRAQIEKVIHLGTRYPTGLAEETAIDILDIVGIEDGKCVFLSSGSEAVEFAAQIARRISKKPLFLAFSNSYFAAYGSAGRKSADEWQLIDWSTCVQPDPKECLKGIPFDRVGAFVFEPGGSGSGFVKFPPKQFVQDISQRIRQDGSSIVANEVTTGIGRTGKWFGFQHYDIQPDIIALGKGLGNGYPVSAVAMKHDIAVQLEKSGFQYAQSHQNDPLACAIAKEVIHILRGDDLIERGNAVGAFFLEGLKRLEEKYNIVKEARGKGMLLGLELFPHEQLSVQSVYRMLLELGFLVGYYSAGNVLRFDPALTIHYDDINQLLKSLDRILDRADSKAG